jgi:sulfite dehydrogenase (quinone) subunit SoeC
MNPAWSVVIFTTVIGAAQGLVAVLAIAALAAQPVSSAFAGTALALAIGLLAGGLAASFLHLGHPLRAWRAAAMWRTSWLSREVIALPAFVGAVALWWLALRSGIHTPLLPLLALIMAALLWYCTSMIYACLRFIQEWAQPLTLVNFVLTGVSSGLVLASAVAAVLGDQGMLKIVAPAALVATLVAFATRALAIRRNAALQPRSTLQSATGIRSPRLAQLSMGMSAGSFNTREFFHGATLRALRHTRQAAMLLGFVLPALLLLWGSASGSTLAFVMALAVQVPGLLADRWFFFAQARHPQNLYYQVVS